MIDTIEENSHSRRLTWLGPCSLILCPVLLGVYLTVYHAVNPLVSAKSVAALYFLCFVPGYLVQHFLFRLKGLSKFEGLLSSLLLGVLLTPLAWYALCWMGIEVLFFPSVILAGLAVPLLGGWPRKYLHQRATGNLFVTPGDAGILFLSLALAVLWSYSMTVVELHDGQAHIIPYMDHPLHATLIAELARGVPAQTVPFISGAEKFAYHEMSDVWCAMIRQATGASLEEAYFYITLTFRYIFVSLGCYLVLVSRFGRPAALSGVVCMLAVVGYTDQPNNGFMLSNWLVVYLHASYPTAFGLTGVFLILYYISTIESQGTRAPLLMASILSVVLLWYKANFALAVAPAVAVFSLIVLAQRKDLRWWWLCVGVQALLTAFRYWQLSYADFAQELTWAPTAFMVWWWDTLRVPPGWPTTIMTTIKQTTESLPAALQWPAVLTVCVIHRFHVGLIGLGFLLGRCGLKKPALKINGSDTFTLLIILSALGGFVFFPVAKGMAWNVPFPLWALICALLFSLVGVLGYRAMRRALHSTKPVALAACAILLVAMASNAYGLRYAALWQTRYRSDVISEDLYTCYRFIQTSTPLESVILQPNPKLTATAGMLTQRQIVLEYDHPWSVNFFETRPILADVQQFYATPTRDYALAVLDRYRVDYVVADLSTGWKSPIPAALTPIFERNQAVVFRVNKHSRHTLSNHMGLLARDGK